jgi:hypothetical protein
MLLKSKNQISKQKFRYSYLTFKYFLAKTKN